MVPAIAYVASKFVEKYHLTVNLDTSMMVTLADGSQSGNVCKTCYMPKIYVYYEQETCVMYDLV